MCRDFKFLECINVELPMYPPGELFADSRHCGEEVLWRYLSLQALEESCTSSVNIFLNY
jgi:hypothetical protein